MTLLFSQFTFNWREATLPQPRLSGVSYATTLLQLLKVRPVLFYLGKKIESYLLRVLVMELQVLDALVGI